jgi:hypothetical protein
MHGQMMKRAPKETYHTYLVAPAVMTQWFKTMTTKATMEPGEGIIKGKTWAQAVARNPQSASTSLSQPTESNISKLTPPPAAQQN